MKKFVIGLLLSTSVFAADTDGFNPDIFASRKWKDYDQCETAMFMITFGIRNEYNTKRIIYDEKIKIQKDNIESARKALQQMDAAVDQTMGRSTDEKGADKANAIRKSQQRDRSVLIKDIESNQKIISALNDEVAPIRAENRKVEAEVGPIKYIAKFIYGDKGTDENMLEKAVTWVIILIVVVFVLIVDLTDFPSTF